MESIRRGIALKIHTILLAVVLLASGAVGATDHKEAVFVYPPDGSELVFNTMDTILVSYTAFYEAVVVYTFCRPGVGTLIYQQKATGFNSTIAILLNFTSATPCWFNVRTGTQTLGVNSASFNIIGQERSTGRQTFGASDSPEVSSSSSSSSSSSTSSSSSASSSSSSSTATGIPSATSSGTSNSNANNGANSDATNNGTPNSTPNESASSGGDSGSGGLSAAASAGIGVGATVGVIALAAGLFMLWRRQRQRPAGPDGNRTYSYGSGGIVPAEMGHHPHEARLAHKWPGQYDGELSTVRSPTEMDSAVRVHHEMSG